MSRPPKKINPGAHRTGRDAVEYGKAFTKGRFPVPPGRRAAADVEIDDAAAADTATTNASFASPGMPPGAPHVEERRSLLERTVTSKYDARPSSGMIPVPEDELRDDVVVDLTEGGLLERKLLVDLSKLPAVDEGLRSDTVYVRHSEGWPTRAGEDAGSAT